MAKEVTVVVAEVVPTRRPSHGTLEDEIHEVAAGFGRMEVLIQLSVS